MGGQQPGLSDWHQWETISANTASQVLAAARQAVVTHPQCRHPEAFDPLTGRTETMRRLQHGLPGYG